LDVCNQSSLFRYANSIPEHTTFIWHARVG
jgi:hypothetical protein